MEKTLHLGKVDAYGSGRKINAVDIEIELDESGELHIVGAIWNHIHSDWASGGQNYEEIARLFPNDEKVQRIVAIWKRWHLNHLVAGTPKQMEWIRTNGHASYSEGGYTRDCERLAEVGLLTDSDYTKKGEPKQEGKEYNEKDNYTYGSRWLKEELPAEIREEIEALINE